MTGSAWIMLGAVVLPIAWIDIRFRYVPPLMLLPLTGAVIGGWWLGGWPLFWLGGAGALIGTLLLKLPLGDVFGYTLCGLLAGPGPTMGALATAALALFLILRVAGHRINLVRHPFFPYLGVLVAAFSIM